MKLLAVFEVDSEEEVERIIDLLSKENNNPINEVDMSDISIRDRAKKVLKSLKLTLNYNGFKYILDAMEMLDKDKTMPIVHLYEDIAQKYKIENWSLVERSIRHCIEVIKRDNSKEEIEEILKQKYNVMCNSVFLYSLLDRIS